jgi:riboflavin biosynthesis pyrimidine reductase
MSSLARRQKYFSRRCGYSFTTDSAGLIDEYRFVVQPILAGEGKRLLEGVSLPAKRRLKLVESKPFESGCVALRCLKQ